MKFAAYTLIAASMGTPLIAGGLNTAPADPVPTAPVMQAPAAPMTGDWTGGYVGADLGYGDISSDPAGADGNGAVYGLTGGYDFDFGNFVLGGALDYDKADIDLGAGGDNLDNIARVKVRGGYDLGRTLVYATGGAAFAEANIGGADLSDNGYVVGLGAEHKITDSISVGGEALYHKFDDFDGSGVDVEATTVSAKVNYRF